MVRNPWWPMLNVITSDIPSIDGCPALSRTKAYITEQGVSAVLEHVWRDAKGVPVDLSEYLQDGSSNSSMSGPTGRVILRIKDALGCGNDPVSNPLWEIPAHAEDAANGVIQSDELPDTLTDRPGIYQLSWALVDSNDKIIATNGGLLSIERSLFATTLDKVRSDYGPPTLNEIRMEILDTGAADNVFLGDVEFSDGQIIDAIKKPIQYWNEVPPPVVYFTTHNFPFRYHWRLGIIANLYVTAAAHYRRNDSQISAGGVDLADKRKERQYLAAAQMHTQEFREWVRLKKRELNASRSYGNFTSDYSNL